MTDKTDKGTKTETEEIGWPAHEAAILMLKVAPLENVMALATMYGKRKVIVPPKEIPALIDAFMVAKAKSANSIDRAISNLGEQYSEAVEKEKAAEKEEKKQVKKKEA